MSGRVKKAAAPRKKANGYKMPAPIPLGEVITDTTGKKKWRIGPSIGVGGFGEIYSACDDNGSPKKVGSYPFVIKIEPHENGPLFVEVHFYVRNSNKADIENYMKERKLSTFGMPLYFGHGSHEYKGEKYRYLVLERYGQNLWDLFVKNGRSFPAHTVFLLGLQMLDVLEYIHTRGYVHADLKGANILLGLRKGTEQQAYLLDFGLAARVNDKEFKPDPKSAHNGTIEYTSRDAHLGVATMRGDLEILGYNMLQWLVGELPWEKSLKQPKAVQHLKEAFMKNVREEIAKLSNNVPEALIKFFEYINTLKPKDSIDYAKCRQLFQSYLKSQGVPLTAKLEFTTKKRKDKPADDETDTSSDKVLKKNSKENGVVKAKRGRKAKAAACDEDGENEEPVRASRKAKAAACDEDGENEKPVRASRKAKAAACDEDGENEKPVRASRKAKAAACDEDGENEKPARASRKAKAAACDEDGENEEPVRASRKAKAAACDEDGENEEPVRASRRAKAAACDEDGENEEPVRASRKAKAAACDEDGENEEPVRASRKAKAAACDEDGENEEPVRASRRAKAAAARTEPEDELNDDDTSIGSIRKVSPRDKKRKSTEPSVLVEVKKTKMAPKATPPAKRNHVHTATQTSVERSKRMPRQVSFDSPVSAVIGDEAKTDKTVKNKSADSSADILDDSVEIVDKKVKPKRKLLSKQEVTVKRVLRKKVTEVKNKTKSWKDTSAIVNGRSPPK